MAARRGSKPLKPDDLPGRDDDMYSPRRTMSAKAALEPRVRCTEVDENGETTITDGEFKKTELIAKVSILLHVNSVPTNSSDTLSSTVFCPAISARSTRPTCRTSSSAHPQFSSTSST